MWVFRINLLSILPAAAFASCAGFAQRLTQPQKFAYFAACLCAHCCCLRLLLFLQLQAHVALGARTCGWAGHEHVSLAVARMAAFNASRWYSS